MTGARPDIRDIKGLVPLPGIPWWGWALAAVVVIAAAYAVYRWRHRKRAALTPAIKAVFLSPSEIALKALEKLLEDRLIERGEAEEFYTRLSDIIRRYLEDVFQLRAPERTTEEFLYEAARNNLLTPSHKDLLQEFLQECDLVKFARHRPGPADMKRGFGVAERFVQETRPAPPLSAPVSGEVRRGE
jgi:hypothetical protein